jgi:hypothetical protein
MDEIINTRFLFIPITVPVPSNHSILRREEGEG